MLAKDSISDLSHVIGSFHGASHFLFLVSYRLSQDTHAYSETSTPFQNAT